MHHHLYFTTLKVNNLSNYRPNNKIILRKIKLDFKAINLYNIYTDLNLTPCDFTSSIIREDYK